MKGLITKRNFIQVAREFGIIAAIRLLFSRQKTALQILMTSFAIFVVGQSYQGFDIFWYVDTNGDDKADTRITYRWHPDRERLIEIDREPISRWVNPIKTGPKNEGE